MATAMVAALGTAAAVYAYRQAYSPALDPDRPTLLSHTNQYKAPDNWVEALYFFTETMRYFYSETLGRWRTADLLLGLLYLSRKEGEGHPASSIVSQGTAVEPGNVSRLQMVAALEEVGVFRRVLALCCVQRLKHRQQAAAWSELGIAEGDVLKWLPRAGMLRPSFSVLIDNKLQAVVLVVRGTHSLKDMFTCLTSAAKPHHMTSSSGVVLGYSHFGMLAAARWILRESIDVLEEAIQKHPGLRLLVVGHSLGGGTAALLTMMLRDQHPLFCHAHCYAIACPCVMTLELSQSCASYVTSIVHGADVVPTFSAATLDELRTEVATSHWYEEFRQSSALVRMVEGGIRSVGCATAWTTRQLVWGASLPVSAVRNLPQGAACVKARRKGSRSPTPEEANAQRSFFSNGIPPDTTPESSPRHARRRRSWRGEGVWSCINPASIFSACSGARRFRTDYPQAPLDIAQRDAADSSLAMSPTSIAALDEEVVQQFEDEITERCEELSQQPENSLQMEMSDILEEVAIAEHEEAIHQASPRWKGKRISEASGVHLKDMMDTSGQRTAADNSPEEGATSTMGRVGWEEGRHMPMYPAGRILHFAPRSALPTPRTGSAADFAAESVENCSSGCDLELWSALDAAATESPVPRHLAQGEQYASLSWRSPCGAVETPPNQAPWGEGSGATMSRWTPPPPNTALACEEHMFLDLRSPNEAVGEVVEESSALDSYVMCQDISNQAYSRIKVCRQMISDHTLPSYLVALDSVQGQLACSLEGSGQPEDYVEPLPLFCHRLKS